MNKIELSLSKELSGLHGYCDGLPFPTIEDLLEILREKGYDFTITGWEDRGKFWVAGIRRPNIDKGIAPRYTGDTLKEALLRACISVLKEGE